MDSWELMRIRGIPLRIHPSWFVIFILFSWIAKEQVIYLSESQVSAWYSWGMGLVTALVLFLSVLLHELGHSYMALREGVKVISITLFFLGGVANVEKECPTPMGNLRVALAGPVVTLILAGFLFYCVSIFQNMSPIFSYLIGQIGYLNLIFGLLNLLPGLPLDGGVIVKSIAWHYTGSQRKGIKFAISTTRFLSIFLLFFGTYLSFKGFGFYALWLISIGWICFVSSRSQNQMLSFQKALLNIKVFEACSRRYRVLEADLPIKKMSKKMSSSSKDFLKPFWLLVCENGRWIGYVNESKLKDIPVQYWNNCSVSEFINPLSELPAIDSKMPLWRAILALEKTNKGNLLVLGSSGLPLGTLDRVDIGKSVLKKIGLDIPNKFLISARKQNMYPLGLMLKNMVDTMISSGLTEEE